LKLKLQQGLDDAFGGVAVAVGIQGAGHLPVFDGIVEQAAPAGGAWPA